MTSRCRPGIGALAAVAMHAAACTLRGLEKTIQGVVVYFRLMDGIMRRGDTVKLMNTKKEHQIDEIGVLAPKPVEVGNLSIQEQEPDDVGHPGRALGLRQ